MRPVTLVDGTVVDSSSEPWRLECEARHLLDRFQLGARRAYLDAIKVRRGAAAHATLTGAIMAVWEARHAVSGVVVD